LSDYGLRYDEEGWLVDMLEEEEEDCRPAAAGRCAVCMFGQVMNSTTVVAASSEGALHKPGEVEVLSRLVSSANVHYVPV
jgi:hypothetical protein